MTIVAAWARAFLSAMVKLFRFTTGAGAVAPRAGVSTKPADGVLVDLELRE